MVNRFKVLLLVVIVALALATHGELAAAKRKTHISVAAGSYDRRETVVSFALPAELKGDAYALRDASGQLIPLQMDSERRATFVLPALKAGETINYDVVVAGAKAKTGVDFMRRSDGLDFKVAGRNVSHRAGPRAGAL